MNDVVYVVDCQMTEAGRRVSPYRLVGPTSAGTGPYNFFFDPTYYLCTSIKYAMMSSEEAQALGRSDFWDERYAKADGDKPTHEWFRAFDALEPFFEKYLFEARGDDGKSSRVMHLGSGDSVCS
jgi:hypothetical protein